MTKAQEQPRDAGGKFGSHEGAAPEIELSAQDRYWRGQQASGGHTPTPEELEPVEQPTEKNGFLLPGKDCECDVDYHCENHDRDAEERYWRGQYVTGGHTPAADEDMAYEQGSPKRSDLSDYFDKMGL